MTRRPDAARTDEPRHDGAEVIALLGRFPNVVAWINGHSHVNRITPHAHATPARSFWEVNTASHADYPHHARLIELADNGTDGVPVHHPRRVRRTAPHRPGLRRPVGGGTRLPYREVAYNAPGLAETMKGGVQEGWAGGPGDRNAELVVAGGSATA